MSSDAPERRAPTAAEQQLLLWLAERSGTLDASWAEGLLVSDMDDGRMGSLRLHPSGVPEHGRRFGRLIAEHQFRDSDDVDVLISFLVDEDGRPFELDVWKTDFSPLRRFPAPP